MPELRVAGAALLEEGQTQAFPLKGDKHERNGFIIRRGGTLHAFLNECPHWSVDLDMGDEDFFDPEIDRIYCKSHGALFVLPSGECETGPCLGQSLTKYGVRVEGEDVIVAT